jgi:methylase of polypeptide subunit release factors
MVLLQCHALSWTSKSVWRSTGSLFLLNTPTCQITALNASSKSQIILDSGKSATIRSRLVTLTDDWNVTVWEWDEPAVIMEHYWSVQQNVCSQQKVLDPFGLVSWPGAVVAAREMLRYKKEIQNSKVLVLGAGPGVEAQALAMLGAKQVIASDVHPTTLRLLRYGAQQSGLDGIIQGQGAFQNDFEWHDHVRR